MVAGSMGVWSSMISVDFCFKVPEADVRNRGLGDTPVEEPINPMKYGLAK